MNISGLFDDTSLALPTQPVSVVTITARLQWELWRENVIEWCVTPWSFAPPPPHTHICSVDESITKGVASKLWLVDGSSCSKLQALEMYFSSGFVRRCFYHTSQRKIPTHWIKIFRFRLLHIENVKMLIRSRKIYKRSKFLGRYPTQCFQLGDASFASPFSNAHAITSYSQKRSMMSAHKNEELAPLAGTEQPCNVAVFYSTVWNSTYFHL